jgi:hypothetical protein
LTTGFLGAPHLISFRQVQTEVVAAGPSAGRIKEVEAGRLVRAADTVEIEGFLDYMLTLLRR